MNLKRLGRSQLKVISHLLFRWPGKLKNLEDTPGVKNTTRGAVINNLKRRGIIHTRFGFYFFSFCQLWTLHKWSTEGSTPNSYRSKLPEHLTREEMIIKKIKSKRV